MTFAHGWPVCFAMSEFAIAFARDATVIINTAINIAIAAHGVEIELIVFDSALTTSARSPFGASMRVLP